MISNERSWPHLRRPIQTGPGYGRDPYSQPRPPVNEDTLKTMEIQIERKFFQLTLKENVRGRFLRITEDGNGKRNTIIIPSSGLADFKTLVNEMLKASEAAPAKSGPAADDDSVGNR
jgi:hypothetical protein